MEPRALRGRTSRATPYRLAAPTLASGRPAAVALVADGSRRKSGRPQADDKSALLVAGEGLYVEDLGNNNKRFVWVLWKTHGNHYAAPVEP